MALTVDIKIKNRFFDRPKVIKALGKARTKVLRRAGGEVRKRAFFSIKRKKGTSAPGSQPFDHVGQVRAANNRKRKRAGQAVKKANIGDKGIRAILFGLSDRDESAIVGPVKLNAKGSNVPAALEHGERSTNAAGDPVDIAARPFMNPALAQVAPALPGMFRDSVK